MSERDRTWLATQLSSVVASLGNTSLRRAEDYTLRAADAYDRGDIEGARGNERAARQEREWAAWIAQRSKEHNDKLKERRYTNGNGSSKLRSKSPRAR